ncbi:sigma-70 family RNA polymerase sigma factor [Clostridium butyricum]|uniref:sigma-70 family RNA polymerase sigma factor n=1 Tax=Clostridium butyricum TaxID=1492 RepID=UPI001F4C1819|nr:sigma-70 family RNA polymerase sigma factor [Clostridium butyricum]
MRYPEAETDLIIYLYELLKSLNPNKFEKEQDIVAYINRCLKNRSILLYYKDFKDKELMSFTSETEILDVIDINDRSDEYSDIRFNDLISILKPKQKEITFYKFYMQFSDVEIAKMLKISRQAVNKTQRLALRNLKTQLSI